jgi:sigma-B regulation protein RsbU (phosphoserine phosphatase)
MSSHESARAENILIVDDLPANLRLLSQMLANQGYRVRAVTSGERALESARLSTPNLILLDIKMPGLSGYETCEQLKSDPLTRDVPVIFISSLDDLQDKVRAFSAGGVDYVTKPFQLEEVLARVQAHLALRHLQAELEAANRKMARELTLAGEVQATFLPKSLPVLPGWDIAVTLKPARQTSGDFYDLHLLSDDKLGLLVADVVDKGVGAALYMALSWALIRTYVDEFPDQPERVLSEVNRRMLSDTHSEEFVTVFYGILDVRSGLLTYGNAGHHPGLLFRARPGAPVQRLARTGMVLGISGDEHWRRDTVELALDDVLVLYTDGVTDAEDGQGHFFGQERLIRAVESRRDLSAAEIRDAVLQDIDDFVGDSPQSDDIALMILARRS